MTSRLERTIREDILGNTTIYKTQASGGKTLMIDGTKFVTPDSAYQGRCVTEQEMFLNNKIIELKEIIKEQEERNNRTKRLYYEALDILREIYEDLDGQRKGAMCPVCGTYSHKHWCWWPFVVDFLNESVNEYDLVFIKEHKERYNKQEEEEK